METKTNAAQVTIDKNGTQSKSKGSNSCGQFQRVYDAFMERPKTMLEVSIETNILRANICRYVSKMRTHDQVTVVRQGLCPITKFRAGFLSTNPVLFPKVDYQRSLFGKGGCYEYGK